MLISHQPVALKITIMKEDIFFDMLPEHLKYIVYTWKVKQIWNYLEVYMWNPALDRLKSTLWLPLPLFPNESSLTYSKYIETAPVGIQYNACLEPFLIWVLADLVQWETVMQYDKPLALFKGLSEVSKTLWMKWTVPHRRACHEEFNKCKHPFKIPPWVLCECRHVNTWALQFIFLWQTLDQTI